MQQAAITNFLQTIVIILAVYYVLKIVARIAFPLLFKKVMRNVEKKFNEQQYGGARNQKQTKEGETLIDKTPNQAKKSNDSVGEYVDYEEIE